MEIDEVEILGVLFSDEDDDLDIVANPEIGSIWGAISHPFRTIKKTVLHPVRTVGEAMHTAGDAAKLAGKGGAAVIKSPITKVVAGGVAIAFPAVGVPLAAGLVVADKALRVAEGVRGTPSQQAAMRRTLKTTVALAAKGDPDAKRAVSFMAAATRIRATAAGQAARAASGAVGRVRGGKPGKHPAAAKKAEGGILVKRGGIVERGTFVDAK